MPSRTQDGQGRVVALELNHPNFAFSGPAPLLFSVSGTQTGLSENCIDLVGSAQASYNLPGNLWGAEAGVAGFVWQAVLAEEATILTSYPQLRENVEQVKTLLGEQELTEAGVMAVAGLCKRFQVEGLLPTMAQLVEELKSFVIKVRETERHRGAPVLVVGHSAGGNLAMEVACALRKGGFNGVVRGLGVGGEGHHSKCSEAYQLVHELDGPRQLRRPDTNAAWVITPSFASMQELWRVSKCKHLVELCSMDYKAWREYGISHAPGLCMHQVHQGYALSKLILDPQTSFKQTANALCSPPRPRADLRKLASRSNLVTAPSSRGLAQARFPLELGPR